MKRYIQTGLIVSIITVVVFLSGCIKEDYDSSCISGIRVSFYSKVPCLADTVYPAQIRDITLGVFDENDRLVTIVQKDNIEFNKNYTEDIELTNGRSYTVVAWTGIKSPIIELSDFQKGETQEHDLLFRLKRLKDVAYSLEGTQMYFGEIQNIKSVSLGVFENVAINLQEITNRLTVSLTGWKGSAEDYEIYIESDNGAMEIDGVIADDDIIKHYPVMKEEAGELKAKFSLLKLDVLFNNTFIIRNKVTNKEIYRGSLLNSLLLKNPNLNLECNHDFFASFELEDKGGSEIITEIWVNDWLVHSYDTEM